MAKREYKANNANLELYQKLNIMISKAHATFINNIKSTGLIDKYNIQDWKQSEWSGNGTLAKSQSK